MKFIHRVRSHRDRFACEHTGIVLIRGALAKRGPAASHCPACGWGACRTIDARRGRFPSAMHDTPHVFWATHGRLRHGRAQILRSRPGNCRSSAHLVRCCGVVYRHLAAALACQGSGFGFACRIALRGSGSGSPGTRGCGAKRFIRCCGAGSSWLPGKASMQRYQLYSAVLTITSQ